MLNQDELDLLLVAAIKTNNVALVQKVIDQGANVNRLEAWFLNGLEGVDDYSPLCHAVASYPFIEDAIITTLLNAGANPNTNPNCIRNIFLMYGGSDENDHSYFDLYNFGVKINKRQFRFLLTSLLKAGLIASSLAESVLEKARNFIVYEKEYTFFKEMLFLVLLHGSYMPQNPNERQYAPGEASMPLKIMYHEIECWPFFMSLYCLNYKNMYVLI